MRVTARRDGGLNDFNIDSLIGFQLFVNTDRIRIPFAKTVFKLPVRKCQPFDIRRKSPPLRELLRMTMTVEIPKKIRKQIRPIRFKIC